MRPTKKKRKKEKKNTRKNKTEEAKRTKKGKMKYKTKQACVQGSGRVPRTRLIFAGTTSPMICPADGPTYGRHKKTRREARSQTRVETES